MLTLMLLLFKLHSVVYVWSSRSRFLGYCMMDFAELTNTQATQWLEVKNFSLDELKELRPYTGSALLGLLEMPSESWPPCLTTHQSAQCRLFAELHQVRYSAEGNHFCCTVRCCLYV
jgi:hypothetical protein